MTSATVRRNASTSTIRTPPTRASIDGMFGYSVTVFGAIFHLLPPAIALVKEWGNTFGETILIPLIGITETILIRASPPRPSLPESLLNSHIPESHSVVRVGLSKNLFAV